jgi:uncharacterized SAM-dependent methyltransferase
MSSIAAVTIHASQFPDNVRRDLLESLRRRRVDPKFHYDSIKQTQRWLELHQASSPSRTDPDCAGIYDRSFAAAARHVRTGKIHVIGLGCGGGQKDARLLRLLKSRATRVGYTPCDVSVAMVLVARQSALDVVPERDCSPLVCDLATADDLPAVFETLQAPGVPRLVTFFGMIPNFEPSVILPKLVVLVRPGDLLLFSANLAPGKDYAVGMRKILPQYDNPFTRDWLMTFLLDLGVERDDGELRFIVESDPARSGLKRVTANFHFRRPREIRVEGECFKFRPPDSLRLFFSYRHTPARVRSLLHRHGLQVLDEWITASGEEGVFFCSRRRSSRIPAHKGSRPAAG